MHVLHAIGLFASAHRITNKNLIKHHKRRHRTRNVTLCDVTGTSELRINKARTIFGRERPQKGVYWQALPSRLRYLISTRRGSTGVAGYRTPPPPSSLSPRSLPIEHFNSPTRRACVPIYPIDVSVYFLAVMLNRRALPEGKDRLFILFRYHLKTTLQKISYPTNFFKVPPWTNKILILITEITKIIINNTQFHKVF